MDQTVLDNLRTAFKDGTTSKLISGSFSDLEKSVSSTIESCENIERNWTGSMWTDISAGFNSPIAELRAYGTEEVQQQAQVLQDAKNAFNTQVTKIQNSVASADHPVQKILSSGVKESIEQVKDLSNDCKILDGWNQFKEIALKLVSDQKSRVQAFIVDLEKFNGGSASGAYVDDILSACVSIRNNHNDLLTELSQLISVVQEFVKGTTDTQQPLLSALNECKSLLNKVKIEEVPDETALYYGVEGLLKLVDLCRANANKVLSSINDSANVVSEYLAGWLPVWDNVSQEVTWVRIAGYKVNASTKSVLGGAVDAVLTATAELKTGIEVLKKTHFDTTGTEKINLNTVLSPILNWENQSAIFLAPITSASQGRTYVNRRFTLLNYLSFYCSSILEVPTRIEEILNSLSTMSLQEIQEQIQAKITEIQKTFDISKETGEPTISFSDHQEDIEDLNESIEDMDKEVQKCCQRVDEMPEDTEEQRQKKEKCKKACNKCEEQQEEASSGGGGCGGNSSNANSNCNNSCCNAACASQLCSAIMGILAQMFTNFMTHGFKWNQGDVFIDGNLFVTKDVYIWGNLFVFKNLVVLKKATVKEQLISGASYSSEFYAGYSIPLLENVNQLWAVKVDK